MKVAEFNQKITKFDFDGGVSSINSQRWAFENAGEWLSRSGANEDQDRDRSMNLKMLKRSLASGRQMDIELHAIEQIMYVPFVRNGEKLRPVVDDQGNSIRYPSRHRALVELAELGLTALDFVHRSSYGEMVGVGEGPQNTEFRETVDLRRYQE